MRKDGLVASAAAMSVSAGRRVFVVLVAAVLSAALLNVAPSEAFADAPDDMPRADTVAGRMLSNVPPGEALNEAATQSDESRVAAEEYQPDEEAAKYVKELVSAGLLTSEVYDQLFYDDVTRLELAKHAMAFYLFLGGEDPGSSGVDYIDTNDLNAKKGCVLGFFDYNDGYFDPDDSVDKAEAITVLAKATIKAKPSEASNVPSADAALKSLQEKYTDAASVDTDDLPYFGFMDARGALLSPRNALSGGDAYLSAYHSPSREDFFLLLSDAAWAFAKNRVAQHAIAPSDPKASEYRYQSYFASAFKNNTYLHWSESAGAYSYSVGIYVSKKLKTKIKTGYASLVLNKTSVPTYRSVFGDLTKKKVCYLKVQVVDRHGMKSRKSLKVNFYAEKFVNLNQKLFGSKTRFGFKNVKAAKKYQKTITVNVWKLVSGKKVKAKMWLTVNKELADDVKRIFAEIYKGKEKFPIKEMGGYQVRANKRSEHNHGTAIDINPTENCMKDGKKVVAGKFWKPGKNKYSIKPNGDVVKAFAKYGWYWGGYGWGDRKDYMHFSYLGT
ncbi:MAG: M15 family metallopeptidase [Clostridiales Family XIII bacterium]|jgi:hypothetical protein|nr:M15 family metallopeptidase [Clostridiales Family XIII bacterium]